MVDSMMAPRVWKWGYTKNRTYWKLSTSAVRASLGNNLGALSSESSRWKYEFGTCGDAISCCLDELLQSLLSRYSITFSILPPPQPTIFPCNFGRITRPIFSKSEVRTPRPPPPWLHQWLDSRVKQRGPRERYIPGPQSGSQRAWTLEQNYARHIGNQIRELRNSHFHLLSMTTICTTSVYSQHCYYVIPTNQNATTVNKCSIFTCGTGIAFIIDSCQYGRVSRMTDWQVTSNSFGIVYCIRVTCD